jgi:O-methyltransferase
MADPNERTMKLTPKRILEGISWRAEALYQRAPLRLRAWLLERRNHTRAHLGLSFVNPSRMTQAYRRAWEQILAEDPSAAEGDYIEFGVYYGSSIACMYDALGQAGLGHVRMFGFDSFEGLPDSADKEPASPWLPGQFSASPELIRKFLRKRGVPTERVTLIRGWFSALTAAHREHHRMVRGSVFNFDCDLHSSTRDALRFAEPLFGRRAIVFFDDWHAAGMAEQGAGQRRALEEFLAEHHDIRAREIDGLEYNSRVKVFMLSRAPAG